MKTMKKLTALVVAVVMVLAMAVTTFAGTITGPENGHTYEVYQILTGTLAEGKLSDMQWGTNATKTGAVSEADAAALQAITGDDTDVAKAIAAYVNMTNPIATVTDANKTVNVADGYYLIVDKGPTGENEGLSLNIVEVVGDLTITPKTGTVDFDKKVKDTNDTTGVVTDWQDSADYDIGDSIPFKLEGTVASDYANYKTYYFAFHDVEEAGLAFEAITSVKIDGVAVDASKYQVVSNPTDKCTFEVIFPELKDTAAHAGSKVVVEYTSKLTDAAVLGDQGNVNKAKLEFSNNPNDTQGGKTGETPWDNVIVFTYKVVIDKVDEKGDPLTGAEFTLTKKVAGSETPVTVAVIKNTAGTEFTFKGLDDGEYTLTETVTPAGYNTISPITFTVDANHNIKWEGETRETILESITGNKVKGEITFTADKTSPEGSLTANVVNKSGSTLPTTGGMGTTVIYVIGAILVLGAGVLLITRRRVAR